MGAVLLAAGSVFAADANKATLENLNKAFNGESKAHARYLAFAKKADEEGYGQVACLFRAAASAEKIHFTAEGKIIQRLGGVPKADVKAPEVKSTKENLEAAIKGETYESQTMYPEFIKTAEAEGVKDAVETFTEAKGAETNHAKLYQEALANLDSWKAKKDFFVCQECGNVVMAVTFENCPVCGKPKSYYKKVS
jgi:rubrerythrin